VPLNYKDDMDRAVQVRWLFRFGKVTSAFEDGCIPKLPSANISDEHVGYDGKRKYYSPYWT